VKPPSAVIPAKAGIHFDCGGRNMDSRFRGNDESVRTAAYYSERGKQTTKEMNDA
jgi:hypothetical protein